MVDLADGGEQTLEADAVLVATGAAPRTLDSAEPDGERILTWEQVYDLAEVPSRMVVVGSGVTGAEFASAYLSLGIDVTLVSSRDRVLPGEDADAAAGARGRARAARHDGHAQVADGVGDPRRRRRHGDPHRRPHRRGVALPAGPRLGAEHRRPRTRGGGGRARRRRFRQGRPGLAHLGPRCVRRRRLHRRPDAGVGGGDAGPDRDVALPRRRRGPARPRPGLLQRLHRPRRSPPSASPSGRSTPARSRSSRSRSRSPATRAPRCRACTTAS